MKHEIIKKTKKNPKVFKGVFVISNDRGLHTRPSTELVKCAASFKCDVRLYYHKNEANAKSLLGILMLAATKGAKIGIEAVGDDAEIAIFTIMELARNNFNIKY